MTKMVAGIVASCCIIVLSDTSWSRVNPAVVGSPILTQSGYVIDNRAQYINNVLLLFLAIWPDKTICFQFRRIVTCRQHSSFGN